MMMLEISNSYVNNNASTSAYVDVTGADAIQSLHLTSTALPNYGKETKTHAVSVSDKSKIHRDSLVNALHINTSLASSSTSSTSSSSSASSMSLSPRPSSRGSIGKFCGIYSPSRQHRGIVARIDEHPSQTSLDKNADSNCFDDDVDEQASTNASDSCNSRKTEFNENNKNYSPTDSAIFSSSNCASIETEFFKNNSFRERRQTIHSKYPLNGEFQKSGPTDNCETWENQEEAANHRAKAILGYRRRFSVPEKSLFHADYAILRKNLESEIEVVGAFYKSDSNAYRNYLDSLTCYDLAPQHGIIITLDAKLTLHKAVTILCLNSSQRVALVCNAQHRRGQMGIFTITDCLHVLQLASVQAKAKTEINEDDVKGTKETLADKSLQFFLDEIQEKTTLVTVTASTTVWDVIKLFRLNHVHRIPVFDENSTICTVGGSTTIRTTNEILSFICLKSIFVELLKLFDSKCPLRPNLRVITLESVRLGTWNNIATINEDATMGSAIEILLKYKVSCLPILCPETQKFVGMIAKDDILSAVAQRGAQNYIELMSTPIKAIIQLDISNVFVTPKTTIENAVRAIINLSHLLPQLRQQHQCIFIVEKDTQQLCGVVSLADIMQFITNNNNNNNPSSDNNVTNEKNNRA